MATKTQIKKFLESKREDVLQELRDRETEAIKQEYDTFFSEHSKELEVIKRMVDNTIDELEALSIKIKGKGEFKNYYSGNPLSRIYSLRQSLYQDNLKEYIGLNSLDEQKKKFGKQRVEVKDEYNNLIAVCNSNKATDSIEILKNLGFDLTYLEEVKEVTTLTTTFNKSNLFV